MDFYGILFASLVYMAIGWWIGGKINDTGETIAIYILFWPLMLCLILLWAICDLVSDYFEKE